MTSGKDSEQVESPEQKDLYSINQIHKAESYAGTVFGALLGYASLLGILYGIISYQRPDVLTNMVEKPGALTALLVGAGMILVAFTLMLKKLGESSFESVGLKNIDDVSVRSVAPVASLIFSVLGSMLGVTFSSDKESVRKSETKVEGGVERFSYGAASSDTYFEKYMTSILGSLSVYAVRSEETATKLLGKGVAFMAGGLFFYVLAIVLWQVFANLLKPDEKVMYVGMAACSMTFIVIEFLAAWFFKQYRYYVEVSMACMRVRSAYDRQLLMFYAQREIHTHATNDDVGELSGSMERLFEVLQRDVNWPSYNAGKENDFNYMVESVGVMHSSMEKVKGLFQSPGKGESSLRPETKG
ncbi:hypothetical protein [Pseudomonas sp. KCJK8927]|uniref:hypothetical protein n=1 Tax=Pseudomonas sp. KCJK8927 TaxID=3344560 RepID=UPI003906A00B